MKGLPNNSNNTSVSAQRPPVLKFLDPPKRVKEGKKDPSVEIVDFSFLYINTQFADGNYTIFHHQHV